MLDVGMRKSNKYLLAFLINIPIMVLFFVASIQSPSNAYLFPTSVLSVPGVFLVVLFNTFIYGDQYSDWPHLWIFSTVNILFYYLVTLLIIVVIRIAKQRNKSSSSN